MKIQWPKYDKKHQDEDAKLKNAYNNNMDNK